ncbi:protein of unknown function (plasmid) [Caballeronia sp. S22]
MNLLVFPFDAVEADVLDVLPKPDYGRGEPVQQLAGQDRLFE